MYRSMAGRAMFASGGSRYAASGIGDPSDMCVG